MPTVVKAYLGTTPLFTGSGGTSSGGWERPEDWLVLPAAEPQSVKMLHAVFDQQENFAALRMITSTGAYQVDWGDGFVETFNSNVTAQHNYDFNNTALDGTLCSRGYKQAVISVTPVSGVFTFFSTQYKYTPPSTLQQYCTGILDMNINLPNLTTGARLLLGGNSVRHNLLERVNITSWGAVTDISGLFFGCPRIQSINETEWNMSNITTLANTFRSCYSLISLDCSNWDISKVTSFNSTFLTCYALNSFKAPNVTTPSLWDMTNAFNSCYSLQELDLSSWIAGNITSLNGTFSSCFSMERVVLSGWNTSKVTNATNAFLTCQALNKIPAINLSAVTTLTSGGFCAGSNSLTRIEATGIAQTVNVSNCMLSATALNEIYTNLAGPVTSRTITVSGNYGTASDDPSIATAKGWTVTG